MNYSATPGIMFFYWGKTFYFNCLTNEKQWNKPSEFVTLMKEPGLDYKIK